MLLDYSHILAGMTDQVNHVLFGFIHKSYDFITKEFRQAFLLCFLLYVITIGLGILQGWFEIEWPVVVRFLIKFIFVSVLLFSWKWFDIVFVEFFTSGVDGISQAMSNSSLAGNGSHAAAQPLSQSLLNKAAKLGLWVWKMGSFSSLLPMFFALVLWVCGLGVVIFSMVHIMLAKIMLTIMLAGFPFVAILLLFTPLQGIFTSWFRLMVSNYFVLLFVSIALGLCFYLLDGLYTELGSLHASEIHILQLIPIVIISVLSFFVIGRCVRFSFDLGSGIAMQVRDRIPRHFQKSVMRQAVKVVTK